MNRRMLRTAPARVCCLCASAVPTAYGQLLIDRFGLGLRTPPCLRDGCRNEYARISSSV